MHEYELCMNFYTAVLNTKLTKSESLSFAYKNGFANFDVNWKTEFRKVGNQITIKLNCICNIAIPANKKTTILTSGSNYMKDIAFAVFCGGLEIGSNVARCTLYADGTLVIISPTPIPANTWIQGTLTTL